MIVHEDCSSLDDLKEEYIKFKDKYKLPEFLEMNRLFDIEEIDIDTDFLLRKIRRVVSERIAGYLRFVEIVLNPSNAPMFFFKLIKKLDEGDKQSLSEVYDVLGKFEVEILALDIDYSEEKEAEFINNVFVAFDGDIKKKLLKVVKRMGKGDEDIKKVSNGGYVG